MTDLFPYGKIEEAAALYDLVIRQYKPYVKCALVSGGDDSMTLIEVLRLVGAVDYVVHIDTTCGLQATQEHVYDYCNSNKLELIIQRSPEETFEDIVLEYGFPGPAQHGRMYVRLKERALRVVQRRFQFENSYCNIKSWDSPTNNKKTALVKSQGVDVSKGNRIIMYFTGARRDESIRRMSTVQEIRKEGNVVWVNLIHNFTKSDIYHIQQQNKIVRNPASIALSRSGECNDGAFGDEAEFQLMKLFYPNDPIVKLIDRLQEKLKGKKFCKYGHGGNNQVMGSEETNAILCSTCINNQKTII